MKPSASTATPPAAVRPPSGSARRSRWRCAGVFVLAFVVGLGAWMYWQSRLPVPQPPELSLTGVDPEVVAVLEQAQASVRLAPRSAAAWGHLAMLLDAHAYREPALPCYATAALLDTREPRWPYLQGVNLAAGSQPAQALPCFARAEALATSKTLPRLRRAELLLQFDRLEEAAAAFEAAWTDDPGEPRVALGLAQLAVARAQDREALSYLETVGNHSCARRQAAALRAAVWQRLGDPAQAALEQRRLAALPEDQPWPDALLAELPELRVGLLGRLERAQSLQQQGRLPQALALLEDGVRCYPDSDVAWMTLGRALGSANDFAGAARALERCVEVAPSRADGWYYLGAARQAQRKWSAALEALRTALKLQPADGAAHLAAGECCEALGDRAGAAAAFRAALRCRPDLEAARGGLARLDAAP